MRRLEDFPEPKETVWPENWEIVQWFRTVQSQFEHNGYCYVRLDYSIAYRDFDDMGITGEKRNEWKRKLRILESAALNELNKPA